MSDATLGAIDRLIRGRTASCSSRSPTGRARPLTCRAVAAAARIGQHDDGRGSHRVRARLGVAQTQVNPRIERGTRNARALRAILRARPGRDHDRRDPRPRDRADRRAGPLTGHLVLATPAHQRCRQRQCARRHGRDPTSSRRASWACSRNGSMRTLCPRRARRRAPHRAAISRSRRSRSSPHAA